MSEYPPVNQMTPPVDAYDDFVQPSSQRQAASEPAAKPVQAGPDLFNQPASTPAAAAPVAVEPATDLNALSGTVELSIPGGTFGHQYGALRVTVPLSDAATLPVVIEQHLLTIGQAAYDVVGKYLAANQPNVPAVTAGGYAAHTTVPSNQPQAVQAAAAPQYVAGQSNTAIQQVAGGHAQPAASSGFVQVNGQYGAITVPLPDALPTQQFRELAVQAAAAELNVPAPWLIVFDNRDGLLNPSGFNNGHCGAVKFSNQCPDQFKNAVVTNTGKQASLAWVDWNPGTNQPIVKMTKAFKDNTFLRNAIVEAASAGA